MRFVSPHAAYKLVIVPADYEWLRGGQRKTLTGIRVEFTNGQFDTDDAARMHHWDADTKQLVETTMMQNVDFGRRGGFYLVGSDVEEVGRSSPEAEELLDTDDALAELDIMCAVTFQTPEGAVPCGNKAAGGSDYCRSHQRLAEKAREKVG